MALFPDESGIDTLYVVVKGTFALGEELTLSRAPIAPVAADTYWGEPGASSLRYASEIHLSKPGTDVVLVGQAWSPNGRRVSSLDVTLQVAHRTKAVRVFGDRSWRSGGISSPAPFDRVPLVYERAFGGVHVTEGGEVLAEERNPVGVGFAGKRKAKELQGQPLPNLEDPRQLLRGLGDSPAPAGFGFVAPSWLPRRAYAGTYDETWQKTRASYLPADFDPRYFCAAHPDLVFDRHLEGGEPVELTNGSAAGPLRFALPRCRMEVTVKVAGTPVTPPVCLETVLLEPDESRLCLTWRAAVPCDKKALKVEQVDIALQELDLGGGGV